MTFQGINAVFTLSQMIGTIIIFYCPFYGHQIYQGFTGREGPPSLSWLCLILLMCSPVSNGFVYGIKSKTIQMTFANLARRQLYQSEVGGVWGRGAQVHREIQQRSPVSGSRRPSITSMLSSTLGNTSLMAAQVTPPWPPCPPSPP